MKNNSAMSRN